MADTYNHRLRLVDLQTMRVSTICGSSEVGYTDALFRQSRLNFPQKVAIDERDPDKLKVYFTELNDCVRVLDYSIGEVRTVCGGNQGMNGLQDGDGHSALMNFPYGIIFDAFEGKLLVTESDNHAIRSIAIEELETKQ